VSKFIELQQQLQNYILSHPSNIQDNITKPKGSTRKTRLDIYKHAYQAKLQEAIEQDFPCLKYSLNEALFDELVEAYINEHQSLSYSLNHYGQYLPNFLTRYPDNYLSELARFEWALCECFEAEDVQPVPMTMIQGLLPEQWPGMRFQFHPSLRLYTVSYNTLAIYQAFIREETLPKWQRFPENRIIRVWKKGFIPHYYETTSIEALSLQKAMANKTFEQICEILTETMSETDATQYSLELLMRWLQDGLIIQICTDS